MEISLFVSPCHNSDIVKHDINILQIDSFMQPASLKMFHGNLSGSLTPAWKPIWYAFPHWSMGTRNEKC